mmetsp:Transcript_30199/g.40150  ORF Transcript_30199/g.40150 Transcript_30199/m.40150 type:complete len:329 (+) Transcript_30199:959-1945(+)
MLPVHHTRDAQGGISDVVRREGLVERVVAHNVWVLGEASRGRIPVSHKLVVHVLLVIEESAEACHTLLRVVVVGKHLLKAILDQVVAILIDSIVKIVHIIALAEGRVVVLEEHIRDRVDARWSLADGFLGVEVRDAFTAHDASENVLVSVDERVDASLAHLVDQGLDTVKVGAVILTGLALDTLPHDAEADEIHTPATQVCDVLIVQRVVGVEVTLSRDVGVNLVDSIDTVKECGAAELINQEASLWVDTERVGRVARLREARAVVLRFGELGCLPGVLGIECLSEQLLGLVDAKRVGESVLITVGPSDSLVELFLLFEGHGNLSDGD